MKKFLPILFIIIISVSVYTFLLIKFKNFTCQQLQCNVSEVVSNSVSPTVPIVQEERLIKLSDNQYYIKPNNQEGLLAKVMLSFDKFYQLDPYFIFEEMRGDPAFNGTHLSVRYRVCNYNLKVCESYFYYDVIDVVRVENAEIQNGALVISVLEDNDTTIGSGYYTLNKTELIMQVDPSTKNLYLEKKIKSSELIDTRVGN